MKKPTSVLRREFMVKMEDLINNSGLPFFVIEPILADYKQLVHLEAERVYQIEQAQYDEYLKAQGESEEG